MNNQLWNNIYKLYGIVLDLRELLGGLMNEHLGIEKDWLPEQLKTVKNLCDTALLLIEHNRRELLPTVLELLHEQSQTIIDKECVIGES